VTVEGNRTSSDPVRRGRQGADRRHSRQGHAGKVSQVVPASTYGPIRSSEDRTSPPTRADHRHVRQAFFTLGKHEPPIVVPKRRCGDVRHHRRVHPFRRQTALFQMVQLGAEHGTSRGGDGASRRATRSSRPEGRAGSRAGRSAWPVEKLTGRHGDAETRNNI